MSLYRERLWTPTVWWLLALLLAGSVWLAYQYVYGFRVSLPASLATLGVAAAVLIGYGRAPVAVERQAFIAGRARLPLSAVGDIEVLEPAAARAVRGRESDPRAYLLLRAYIPAAIKVTVDDPDDPVPYWYVSSRHPRRLAEVLASACSSAPE